MACGGRPVSIDIKFVVGGREVSPDNVADAAKQRAYRHIWPRL
jgi:hypothetical protein